MSSRTRSRLRERCEGPAVASVLEGQVPVFSAKPCMTGEPGRNPHLLRTAKGAALATERKRKKRRKETRKSEQQVPHPRPPKAGGRVRDDILFVLAFDGGCGTRKYVEIVEAPEHPWFLGCQFHPEFKSTPLTPHPL